MLTTPQQSARKAALALIDTQFPQALRETYHNIAQKHDTPINSAANNFKQNTRKNWNHLDEAIKGIAGDAAKESLNRLAGKPREFFTAGIDSLANSRRSIFGL